MKHLLLIFIFSLSSLFAFEKVNVENIDDKIKDKKVILDFYADY